MLRRKKSFFERLTGAINVDYANDDPLEEENERNVVLAAPEEEAEPVAWIEEEEEEEAIDGELSVDVYQTDNDIIIKAMVAGVRPDDLDVSIMRDSVTIRGKREESRSIEEESYFQRELYWGTFSRTIVLPEEIEVDEAEATEHHGLLIIKLPKINKGKQARLKIQSVK